jgi:hypothetical protein
MRAVALLLLAAFAAAAQSPLQNWNNVKTLAAGTEIRVERSGAGPVRGQLQSATDESLVVNSGKGQEMFSRQQVARVSVRGKSHRGRNTLIGLGVGAGVGLAIGAAASTACSGFGCIGTGPKLVAGLGGAGALLGTLVGWALPSGGWREIYRQ